MSAKGSSWWNCYFNSLRSAKNGVFATILLTKHETWVFNGERYLKDQYFQDPTVIQYELIKAIKELK
jgi:hypothetical protein